MLTAERVGMVAVAEKVDKGAYGAYDREGTP